VYARGTLNSEHQNSISREKGRVILTEDTPEPHPGRSAHIPRSLVRSWANPVGITAGAHVVRTTTACNMTGSWSDRHRRFPIPNTVLNFYAAARTARRPPLCGCALVDHEHEQGKRRCHCVLPSHDERSNRIEAMKPRP
jgi:hypothetical protein